MNNISIFFSVFISLFIIFIGVCVLISLLSYLKNNKSPKLIVNATVSNKRIYKQRHINNKKYGYSVRYTDMYYVTFTLEGGDSVELLLYYDDEEYERLEIGMEGKLAFQRTRYIGFNDDLIDGQLPDKFYFKDQKVWNTVRSILSAVLVIAIIFGIYYTGKAQLDSFKKVPDNSNEIVNRVDAPDREAVDKILNENNFETDNIPVTYWFVGEDDLQFVAAGVKEDMKFEFYDYGKSDTVDLCFNEISYKISMDMEPRDRDELMSEFSNEKMFMFTENGVTSVVIHKGNTIVYAYFPEYSTEIPTILQKLGYALSWSEFVKGAE